VLLVLGGFAALVLPCATFCSRKSPVCAAPVPRPVRSRAGWRSRRLVRHQTAALRKELDPLIRKFEEANGIAPNVLTFTGKTKGTGKSKAYELAYTTDPKRTLWVVREKDELKEVKE